jgi:glycosyltransferase involved in cell wall biosynthesis
MIENKRVLFVGEFIVNNSFSNVNRNLLLQFLKNEVDVSIWNSRPHPGFLSFEQFWKGLNHWAPGMFDGYEVQLEKAYYGQDRIAAGVEEFDIALYFVSTLNLEAAATFHRLPGAEVKEKYRIGYFVWSHQNAPKSWIQNITNFDEVWTPSQANRDSFIEAGAPPELIYVVPHGVNRTVFYPTEKKGQDRFRFGLCNSICIYKGADLALNAFMQEFGVEDRVEMIMQSSHRNFSKAFDGHGHWYKEYTDIINRYPKQMHTYYTTKECGPEGIANFIRSCDVIVSPHRGEGFGMIPLESLSCGRPVIVSDFMGPKDYIQPGYKWWVQGRMEWTNRISGRAHFPDGGDEDATFFYFEPDINSIRKAMRDLYEKWKSNGLPIFDSIFEIATRQESGGFSWEHIFKQRVIPRLEDICRRL